MKIQKSVFKYLTFVVLILIFAGEVIILQRINSLSGGGISLYFPTKDPTAKYTVRKIGDRYFLEYQKDNHDLLAPIGRSNTNLDKFVNQSIIIDAWIYSDYVSLLDIKSIELAK